MAKAKGTKVTPREKKRMWELYEQLGSYTLVAKKMHRSPDTISRHIAIMQAKVEMVIANEEKPNTTIVIK